MIAFRRRDGSRPVRGGLQALFLGPVGQLRPRTPGPSRLARRSPCFAGSTGSVHQVPPPPTPARDRPPETIQARGCYYLLRDLASVGTADRRGLARAALTNGSALERALLAGRRSWSLAGIVLALLLSFPATLAFQRADILHHATETKKKRCPLTTEGTHRLPGFPRPTCYHLRLYPSPPSFLLWSVIGRVFAPLAAGGCCSRPSSAALLPKEPAGL